MRESVFFEVRLRRFGVWRTAVAAVATMAIVALAAWTAAMLDAQPPAGRLVLLAGAFVGALATGAVAFSLVRIGGGILSCRDGTWTFAPDVGVARTGALEVAIDLGGFLLLRLADARGARLWLPVQRPGLASQWHALRCAVYAPPPAASGSPGPAPIATR